MGWGGCICGHGDKTEIIGAWVGTHALSILTPDREHVTAVHFGAPSNEKVKATK